MSFLNPISALVAAGVALPLLLLLYFLKLRRRYMRVPSTLLWERAYEDLEVNTPFQRLRYSPLLLLQLLLLASLLLAFARPVTEGEGGRAGRLVMLIDRSASMSAMTDAERSRLDVAKDEAMTMVERLGRGTIDSEVMVIAFGRSPHVVTSFTNDRRTLVEAIESITATDEQADLAAALQLAAGFAGDSEDAGAQEGEVVLFSDGMVGQPDDAAGFRLRSGSFRFVNVAHVAEIQRTRNVGITSFSARRDIEEPERLVVFARLINTADDAIEPVLTLRVDGAVADVRQVRVPGASGLNRASPQGQAAGAFEAVGEETVTFSLELPSGGVLELAHNVDDAMAKDNRAWLVMPAPARPRVLIVHPGDGAGRFIQDLIEGFEPARLQQMTVAMFDDLNERDLDAGELFDLVVFDRASAARLPGVPTISFGGVPAGVEARPAADERGRRILSWDRQHPIMRHVSLDMIGYRGFGGYELPQGASALAHGPEGPVIALLRRRGAHHLMVGFELNHAHTNWPMHVSIAVFMQNAFEHLTLAQSGQTGLAFRAGETVTARARADASELRVIRVGAEEQVIATLSAEPGSVRSLPALREAGVYRVDGAAAPMERIAVNVLSDQESDVRPRSRLIVNAEPAEAGGGGLVVPRELWPWLVAIALVLLVVEWLMYCRRASSA